MICPTCKGAARIDVVAHTISADRKKTSAPMSVQCFTCRGTGFITAEEAKRIAGNRGLHHRGAT